MRPIKDFDKIPASGEFERLAPGGYVLRITDVANDEKKEYLRFTYDIAEGPEAGRYKDETEENAYRHQFIRSYKEKALGMFKAFINAVQDSNAGYVWEWHEAALKGKLVGVVIGYEEYEANDGNIKERQRIASVMSADRIRKGDFKVPELKRLASSSSAPAGSPVPGFTPITDDGIPF